MGVNLPVVLVANKSDLVSDKEAKRVLSEEMVPVMQEFKEVESCVRCSAKARFNVNEVLRLTSMASNTRYSICVKEQSHIQLYILFVVVSNQRLPCSISRNKISNQLL